MQPARQSKFRSEQQWDYYETVNYLTEQLGRLSNINMEVFKNDKKKGKITNILLVPDSRRRRNVSWIFKQGISPHGRLCSIARNIGVSSVEFPDLPIPDCMVLQLFHTNNLNSLSDEEFYSLEGRLPDPLQ